MLSSVLEKRWLYRAVILQFSPDERLDIGRTLERPKPVELLLAVVWAKVQSIMGDDKSTISIA